MSFHLIYTRRAVKDIQKLEQSIKSRIGKALLRFSADPIKYSKRLANSTLEPSDFELAIIASFSTSKVTN